MKLPTRQNLHYQFCSGQNLHWHKQVPAESTSPALSQAESILYLMMIMVIAGFWWIFVVSDEVIDVIDGSVLVVVTNDPSSPLAMVWLSWVLPEPQPWILIYNSSHRSMILTRTIKTVGLNERCEQMIRTKWWTDHQSINNVLSSANGWCCTGSTSNQPNITKPNIGVIHHGVCLLFFLSYIFGRTYQSWYRTKSNYIFTANID